MKNKLKKYVLADFKNLIVIEPLTYTDDSSMPASGGSLRELLGTLRL